MSSYHDGDSEELQSQSSDLMSGKVTIIDQNLSKRVPRSLLTIDHKPLVVWDKPPNVNAANIIFSNHSMERRINRLHKKIMNKNQEDERGRRRARRLKPIYHNILCVLMINLSIMIANGSSSPMAFFAPSPPSPLLHRRSPLLQREAPFDYRSSHHKSSRNGFLATRAPNRRDRRVRSMSKIKSPSNSYTQFYKEGVLVGIESTSLNSRRISGEIVVDGISIEDIWSILTDYDNLSSHVPNLVESEVINGGKRTGGKQRVYQRGAQRIWGFKFGADVTMDMTEAQYHNPNMYHIDFECVNSQFFSVFDGSWIVEEFANNQTMVRYIVDVMPKGPVPVAALEWRIKEDVPTNILAVIKSARAGRVKRKEEYRNTAHVEGVQSGITEPLSSDRTELLLPRPKFSPLQQRNLQTIKALLPTPVYSRVKRSIKAVNNKRSRLKVSSMPSGAIKQNKGFDDNISDWYEDETMAVYLKDL